jgi:hypothetical protein
MCECEEQGSLTVENPDYLEKSRSVYDIKREYFRSYCLISKIGHHQLIQRLAMNAMIEDDNYQLNEVIQVHTMSLMTVQHWL